MLRTGKDGNVQIDCDRKSWVVHSDIVFQSKVLLDKLDTKTHSKFVGTITIKDFESYECLWVLQYLYQGGRKYLSCQQGPGSQRRHGQTAYANILQTGICIDKCNEMNPSGSMFHTGVRLFQIATYLKLNKLADYADRVIHDYLDLMWLHNDMKPLTQDDKIYYAGEIAFVGDTLAARGMDKAMDDYLECLSRRCVGFAESGTWLDNTIAHLRQNVPAFKSHYDWYSAFCKTG